jgi:K+-sensing histidine kinase KdpD
MRGEHFLKDVLLRNLFKNAIRYAQSSTVIHIETYENALQVSNVGEKTEFPEEEIFNRFRRGNNDKTLGLGLAIVKKIGDVNNLTIEYSYNQNRHTFTITETENT